MAPTTADFLRLIAPERPALARFLARWIRDPSLRDDALQETFLRAWRAWRRFDASRPGSPRTWLFQIGRNVALNTLRDRRETAPPRDVVDPGPGPVSVVDRRWAVGRVWRSLPATDREVLFLKYCEGMSYEEIGDRVGSSGAAVKQRAWRAVRKLRQDLEKL